MMSADIVGTGGILTRLGIIAATPRETAQSMCPALAAELLRLSESTLETWLKAHGASPTERRREGFRLLGLHAQSARGEPSFNACRETCREIVYQNNVIAAATDDEARERALRLMIMVVRHLALFVSGKLEVAGLGEFCCASRPLRQTADSLTVANQPTGA